MSLATTPRDASAQTAPAGADAHVPWHWKQLLSIDTLPPWLVSLAVHMTAIILLAFASFQIQKLVPPQMEVQAGDAGGMGDYDLGTSDGGQNGDLNVPGDGKPLGGLEDQIAFHDSVQNSFAAPTLDPASLVGLALPSEEPNGKGGKGFAKGGSDGKSIGDGDGSKLGNGTTSLFGVGATGKKFVYVFDRSESMNYQYYTDEPANEFGNIPIRASKAELLASIYELNQKQQFFMIFYNHQPQLYNLYDSPGHPQFATKRNKEKLRESISELRGEGGTNHFNALMMALRLQGDVIYLMTDGEAKDDLLPGELDRIRELNNYRAKINVIQFAKEPRPMSTMVRLAQENGGKHVFIDVTKIGKLARKPGEF
jgi:hypothetical protein